MGEITHNAKTRYAYLGDEIGNVLFSGGAVLRKKIFDLITNPTYFAVCYDKEKNINRHFIPGDYFKTIYLKWHLYRSPHQCQRQLYFPLSSYLLEQLFLVLAQKSSALYASLPVMFYLKHP